MWGQVGAESRPRGCPELVPADPLSTRGISGAGFSQGHLGQGETWLVPSLSSLLALSPSQFQRGWHVLCALSLPAPACPMPPCVCQGIRFCAILNNSIFIGPTKTYRPLPAHTPPVCAPLTPAMGQLAFSAFPMPLPPASLCSLPPKNSLAHAPVMPSLPGERGMVPGVTAGDTPRVGRGWGGPAGHPGGSNQRKSLAVPSSGLVVPSSRGGFLYFISVASCSQSPDRPCTTRKCPLKTSPWLCFFFRAVSVCPEKGWGVRVLLPSRQCCPPLGPSEGSSSMPLGWLWLLCPLPVLRPATAWCRNEPPGSS